MLSRFKNHSTNLPKTLSQFKFVQLFSQMLKTNRRQNMVHSARPLLIPPMDIARYTPAGLNPTPDSEQYKQLENSLRYLNKYSKILPFYSQLSSNLSRLPLVLYSLARSGNADRIHSLVSTGCLDQACYVAIFRGLEASGSISAGLHYFNLMPHRNTKRTIYHLNIIIIAYSTKSLKRTLQVFDSLPQLAILPDYHTFYTVISACCKASSYTRVDSVVQQMFDDGIPPDLQIWNLILGSYASINDIPNMNSTYKQMASHNIAPDIDTFYFMLQAYKQIPEQMQKVFNEMITLNIMPDTRTFLIFIESLVRQRQFAQAQDMYDRLITMKVAPNLLIYKLLFGAKKHHSASRLVKMMSHLYWYNITPDTALLNTLIRILGSIGFLKTMKEVMLKMIKQGAYPNTGTMDLLLSGYSSRKDFKSMKEVLKGLKQLRNVSPTIISFNIIIKAYADSKMFEKVIATVITMKKKHGLLPNAETCNHMVAAYAAAGDFLGAEALLNYMESKKFILSSGSTQSIIIAGKSNPKWLQCVVRLKS